MRTCSILLCVLLFACGGETSGSGAGGASASTSSTVTSGGDAGVDACDDTTVVETHLPSLGLGDVITLCTSCDYDCPTPGWQGGEACSTYGEYCPTDDAGTLSVCVACCDGTAGVLRCRKHQ